MIDAKLMKILACPQCKGKVTANTKQSSLDCSICQLAYPVRDDIPVMLVDEASPLKDTVTKEA